MTLRAPGQHVRMNMMRDNLKFRLGMLATTSCTASTDSSIHIGIGRLIHLAGNLPPLLSELLL